VKLREKHTALHMVSKHAQDFRRLVVVVGAVCVEYRSKFCTSNADKKQGDICYDLADRATKEVGERALLDSG